MTHFCLLVISSPDISYSLKNTFLFFFNPIHTANIALSTSVTYIRTAAPYLYGCMCVEHVLQAEVAAVVEVVLAELLHQLEVVETVSQRHGLLEADICSARGGVRHTSTHKGGGDSKGQAGRRGKDKAQFMFKKRTHQRKMTLLFPVVLVPYTLADFNHSECLKLFMTQVFKPSSTPSG